MVEKKGEGLMDETVLCVSMSSISQFHPRLVHSHVHQCVRCNNGVFVVRVVVGVCVFPITSFSNITHSQTGQDETDTK